MARALPAGTRAVRRGDVAARSVSLPSSQRLGLGGEPGDRGVGERRDQSRVAATQPALVHLQREVLDAAVDQRLRARPQAVGLASGSRLISRTRPSSAGPAHGRPEHGRTTASIALERVLRRRRTAASITTTSSAAGLEHGIDQLVLAGNQYRTVCLRTPTSRAISSSETASTPRAEQVERRHRGSVGGSEVRSPRGTRLYQVVDKSHCDRRIARWQAHRHHGGHRVRGHGAGRTAAARRPRLRADPARARRQAHPGRHPHPEGTAQERRLRPAAGAARRRPRRRVVPGDDRPTDHHHRRRRRHRRARPERRRPGDLRHRRHRHPLRRHRVVRLAADVGDRDQPARDRRASPSCCHELGITPHLVAVSTCYVAGNRRGSAPEQLVSEGPFDIGLDWRAEVAASPPAQERRRSSQPHARAARRVPQGGRGELGAAGAPALAAKTEQVRERGSRTS